MSFPGGDWEADRTERSGKPGHQMIRLQIPVDKIIKSWAYCPIE